MADNFELRSAAFQANQPIPVPYTCVGEGMSPPLAWTDPPDRTQSLALVMDDPDAPGGTFVHWLLFNLPPDRRGLPEGVDLAAQFEDDATPVQGGNGFGDIGYGPPCPPAGDGPHHYSFRLHALDTVLDFPEGVDKHQLTQAMHGHTLAEADLVGTFEQ